MHTTKGKKGPVLMFSYFAYILSPNPLHLMAIYEYLLPKTGRYRA